MQVNLIELRLKIDSLKKEREAILHTLKKNAVNTAIKELNGVTEVLEQSEYPLETSIALVEELSKAIAQYSSILSKANSTVRLNVDCLDQDATIQDGLCYLKEFRGLLQKVTDVLDTCKESKTRKSDGTYGTVASSYYQLITLNYDKEGLGDYKRELEQRLDKIEVAIQAANTTCVVTIRDILRVRPEKRENIEL
ncbi:hypothetical protein D3C81_07070 [compost metagenome]